MRQMAVTCMIILLSLAPWVASGELGRAGTRPQIITFDGAELSGDHTHVVGDIGGWAIGTQDSPR